MRTSQYSCIPHALHYHGVKHILKYLHATKDDGIFFWWTTSNEYLLVVSPPAIRSNVHDLLFDRRPSHDPLELHGFVDSNWAACPQTCRSFAGTCLCLAGGCVAYKTQLLPTVALSSTEAEYCHRPSRYVPYKGTFVLYDGTFGGSNQGQTLDV